ncbi:Hypothetical predicted protein [Pelobates cultripes]|uniref:Uncharacterized protein n=1 Tax=Pelobates cultripes TaxID=61616 RepID=A0AAD1S5E3_PELCU|nr:Hypothetical predicted protein [Pelobates cultripes]
MVQTKRPNTPGPAGTVSPRRNTGPMDEFIATPSDLRGLRPANKMAPASSGSESAGETSEAGTQFSELAQIQAELTQISAKMLTKADTSTIAQELRAALREELVGLRSDLTALEQRVDEVETAAQGCEDQHRATEVAVTRQGNLLITLRRQVEDLENRSRRKNIRIRGMPETETEEEPLHACLCALFTQILGEAAPEEIHMDRAHRALGPARRDGSPRDVICCMTLQDQRDMIMAAAKDRPSILFRGGEISLYQDLSKEVPRMMRTLNLPPVRVRNWILDEAIAARRDPLNPSNPAVPPIARATRPLRRGGPNGAEE